MPHSFLPAAPHLTLNALSVKRFSVCGKNLNLTKLNDLNFLFMPHLLHRVDRLVAGWALGHLTPLTDSGHLPEVISVCLRYNPLTDNECWGLRLASYATPCSRLSSILYRPGPCKTLASIPGFS